MSDTKFSCCVIIRINMSKKKKKKNIDIIVGITFRVKHKNQI